MTTLGDSTLSRDAAAQTHGTHTTQASSAVAQHTHETTITDSGLLRISIKVKVPGGEDQTIEKLLQVKVGGHALTDRATLASVSAQFTSAQVIRSMVDQFLENAVRGADHRIVVPGSAKLRFVFEKDGFRTERQGEQATTSQPVHFGNMRGVTANQREVLRAAHGEGIRLAQTHVQVRVALDQVFTGYSPKQVVLALEKIIGNNPIPLQSLPNEPRYRNGMSGGQTVRDLLYNSTNRGLFLALHDKLNAAKREMAAQGRTGVFTRDPSFAIDTSKPEKNALLKLIFDVAKPPTQPRTTTSLSTDIQLDEVADLDQTRARSTSSAAHDSSVVALRESDNSRASSYSTESRESVDSRASSQSTESTGTESTGTESTASSNDNESLPLVAAEVEDSARASVSDEAIPRLPLEVADVPEQHAMRFEDVEQESLPAKISASPEQHVIRVENVEENLGEEVGVQTVLEVVDPVIPPTFAKQSDPVKLQQVQVIKAKVTERAAPLRNDASTTLPRSASPKATPLPDLTRDDEDVPQQGEAPRTPETPSQAASASTPHVVFAEPVFAKPVFAKPVFANPAQATPLLDLTHDDEDVSQQEVVSRTPETPSQAAPAAAAQPEARSSDSHSGNVIVSDFDALHGGPAVVLTAEQTTPQTTPQDTLFQRATKVQAKMVSSVAETEPQSVGISQNELVQPQENVGEDADPDVTNMIPPSPPIMSRQSGDGSFLNATPTPTPSPSPRPSTSSAGSAQAEVDLQPMGVSRSAPIEQRPVDRPSSGSIELRPMAHLPRSVVNSFQVCSRLTGRELDAKLATMSLDAKQALLAAIPALILDYPELAGKLGEIRGHLLFSTRLSTMTHDALKAAIPDLNNDEIKALKQVLPVLLTISQGHSGYTSKLRVIQGIVSPPSDVPAPAVSVASVARVGPSLTSRGGIAPNEFQRLLASSGLDNMVTVLKSLDGGDVHFLQGLEEHVVSQSAQNDTALNALTERRDQAVQKELTRMRNPLNPFTGSIDWKKTTGALDEQISVLVNKKDQLNNIQIAIGMRQAELKS